MALSEGGEIGKGGYWVSAGCLILLLLLPGAGAAEDDEDGELRQRRLTEIAREKADIQEKLQETVQKEQNALLQVSKLRTELRENKTRLGNVQVRLQKKRGRITQLQRSVSGSLQKIHEHQDVFSSRIREIYQGQNLGYLAFLFSAHGWDQILQHQYTFERIINQDIQMMEEMKQELDAMNRQKILLRREEQELHDIRKDLIETVADVQYKERLQSAYKEQLARQREAFELRIAELEQTSREIENMLRQRGGSNEILGTGQMILPCQGWVSSGFGYRRHPIFRVVKFHTGVDIAAPRGRKIVAADSGRVVHAGWWGGYGQATILDHGGGLTTVYAHQSRIVVQPGQLIQRGETIGYVGSTGNSTGPHLHFEVRRNGGPIDPMNFLRNAQFGGPHSDD